jgi:hypothetical protein
MARLFSSAAKGKFRALSQVSFLQSIASGAERFQVDLGLPKQIALDFCDMVDSNGASVA